ncbi:AMP-binding protein [Spongisporangium articulatum]|uniref:AMP-binding protein n=1 Tax=Spongisporangium articulatum TaxID=3362603 RepID=A0ABW8AJB1_9ACTN
MANSGAGTAGKSRRPRSVINVEGSKVKELGILVRGGVLSPGRPDRVVKRLGALAKFGPSLAGSFAAAAARDPHGGGIIDDERAVTYGELDARVRRLAAGFADLGIGPEGGIAMLQRNSIYAVETLVAASRAGADAVLLSTFLSPGQITEVLKREAPKAIIVDADLSESLQEVPEDMLVIVGHPGDGSVVADTSLDQLALSSHPELDPPEKPGRIVILTSGTTGTPKGAKRGAPKGLSAAASILSRLNFRPKERMLIAPPVFHTWGFGMLQLAPALGSTIVLRRKPDAETILAAIEEHKCTSAIVVPVMAQRMVDLPAEVQRKYDLSSLKVVACSSAAVSKDLSIRFQDTFGDVLYNIYGATEVSWATIANPQDLRLAPGTAGRPPIGTRLALLNEKGRPVKLGDVGTIYVGNEMTFEGYTNGNDKARANGLLSTGDKGMIDENGLLMVMGRDDDMVISGGENVYPIEVEELLVAHPDITEAVVVGVPDADMGQRLAAYVVTTEGSTLDVDGVKNIVRQKLARFSVPRDVVFLDALPRNTVGKVVPRLLPPSA